MRAYVFLWIGILLGSYALFSTAQVPGCENCGCCVNGTCSREYVPQIKKYVDDVCTEGCIDGIAGRRCYNKCPDGCSTCEQNSKETCTACTLGYYLTSYNNCSACPSNCESCTLQTECLSCSQNFRSITCDQCSYGFYGQECDTPCPSTYCNNSTCIKNTGECVSCPKGMYGSFCERECSLGCMQATCDVKSGSCLDCLPSYSGDKCCVQGFCRRCSTNTVCEICVDGYFGVKCDKPCPDTCQIKNRILQCDRTNGVCSQCSDGLHGDYCNLTCSSHCLNNRCSQHNGHCSGGCIECYGGPSCTDVTCYSDHLIGITIGSSAAVVIAILTIVIISSIFIMRRWKKKMLKERQEAATAERRYVNAELNMVSVGISDASSRVDLRGVGEYEQLDERKQGDITVYEQIQSSH